MTKPKHLYVPPEERTGAAVRTPAQLEALAKGRARYMEKVAERKAKEKKEKEIKILNTTSPEVIINHATKILTEKGFTLRDDITALGIKL